MWGFIDDNVKSKWSFQHFNLVTSDDGDWNDVGDLVNIGGFTTEYTKIYYFIFCGKHKDIFIGL